MSSLSRSLLWEMYQTAHRLKCDICACCGKEIENISLASALYRLYIQSDILSGSIPRKGAEKAMDKAKNATANTLQVYADRLLQRDIHAQAHMEKAYISILEGKQEKK